MVPSPPLHVTYGRLHRPNGPPSLPAMRMGRPLTAVALLAFAASTGCAGNAQEATPTERVTTAVSAPVQSTLTPGSISSGTSTAPGSVPTTAPPTGYSTEQQAVIAAHDQAIKGIDSARAKSDPADATLPSLLSHDMLRDVKIDIDQRTKQGIATRRPDPSDSRIEYLKVSVDGTDATVSTCEIDDAVAYRISDGSIVNDKVTTSSWSIAMALEDGVWKLAGRHQIQTWRGKEMDTCHRTV